MLQNFFRISVSVLSLALVGCSSCTTEALGAAPSRGSRVYTPVCKGGNYDRPETDEVYKPSVCGPLESPNVRCPLRGLGIPGLECVSELPAPAAAPAPATHPCNPDSLPKSAKPGEVYCWVFVQPPAAAPVQVYPSRTEWQRVDCPPGPNSSDCCWRLVEIPAVFAAPPPPPGYWEWQLNPNCKPPVAPAAKSCSLPSSEIEDIRFSTLEIHLPEGCTSEACVHFLP